MIWVGLCSVIVAFPGHTHSSVFFNSCDLSASIIKGSHMFFHALTLAGPRETV